MSTDPTESGPRVGGRRPYAATSGALLAAVPIPWAVTSWAHDGIGSATPLWAVAVLVVATAGFLLSGLVLANEVRAGRSLATLGILGTPILAVPRLVESPGLTLLLVVIAMFGMVAVWGIGATLFAPASRRAPLISARVRGSALVALTFWLGVGFVRGTPAAGEVAAVGVSMLVAIASGAAWLVRCRHGTGAPARIVAAGLAATACLAIFTYDDAWSLVGCGGVYAVVAIVFGPRSDRRQGDPEGWWAALLEHPERILVASFAMMAAVGTVILALPQSSAGGVGIGGLDAAFTAVSAVCVTGLIVRDTPAEFSALGHATILVLIQLGGLGIMTFSTAALRVLGRRMSLRQESAVAHLIGTKDRSRLVASAQGILVMTFVVEGIGIVLLTVLFLAHGDSIGTAAWRALFTAVSAFCNAGFALQSDSLVPYQHAPLVLHVVGTLIVLGGLSPAVVLALPAFRSRRPKAIPAQVRMCLAAAAILLASGFGFYLASEWDHSLGHLAFADKVHNAWFQSVTMRTAGFNSVDIAATSSPTFVMILAFMFVGASPGGTAGGIKTTTAAILLLSVVHTIRGSAFVSAFGRRIPEQTIQRAAVIATVAGAVVFLGTFALLLTQDIPLSAVVFEAVSAVGTVGLSVGATGELDDIGKIVVLFCMFIGRIGGLSLMMLMGQRTRFGAPRPPIEDIDVG